MKLQFITQNSKMKKSTEGRVFNFGIPAKETCKGAGECKKFCYAAKGFYLWPSAKNAQHRRWAATKLDNFPEEMIKDIIWSEASHIRIHDSGDFYDREYLSKWLKIIESLPHVTFYAYTKMIPLFRGVKLPENFTVIYSFGGIFDAQIDTKNDRHAAIFKESIPSNYINASENDLNAIKENKNVGLIAH
jgi:hypothetical protein